ncbi:hypothetical protein JZU56_04175, partial [bacterium]|nr:hypothetical protein [bacterium]
MVAVLIWVSFAAGTDDTIIGALVAEEANCTPVNQTFELARMCKKDVIERLFLYIAMQQLHIARRKDQRDERKETQADALDAKKKKEAADNASGAKAFAVFMIVVVMFASA